MREQVVRNIEEDFLLTSFNYLVEHGLENTSVRDLCKSIGISSGSLYYWFEGKDDVYINAAKYGLSKVAEELFKFAFDEMTDLKNFFDKALLQIGKYKAELRLIYQVATSPIYGDRMRREAENLMQVYEEYIEKLSKMLKIKSETLAPIVFMFISIILDYVIWEDYTVAKMQIDFIYKQIANLVDTL